VTDLGAWSPFAVETVAALMEGAPVTWWLSGGCALDRFAGTEIRPHGDVDISLRRSDWEAFGVHVSPMLECYVARDGDLSPARNELAAQECNIWAREVGGGDWRIQINLEPVVGVTWEYRRDGRVHRPLDEVVRDAGGIPCVNPAVQLLWKAKAPREIDELDYDAIVPLLPHEERAWLAGAIALAHPASPWVDRLP
jgi:hypothetical protein